MRTIFFKAIICIPLGIGFLLAACDGSRTASSVRELPLSQQSIPPATPTSPPIEAGVNIRPKTLSAQLPQDITSAGQTRSDQMGIAQVWVPAGCFQMGSDPKKDPQAQPNEQPQHEVCITKGFWLDQYEVTNAAFQQFIVNGGYMKREFWSDAGWQWKGNRIQPQDIEGFTAPQQPRVGINWYEAEAYAKWRGGRLPTEAEWEYAARGATGTIYPWGDIYQIGWANVNETSVGGQGRGKTLSVGSFPNGKSWVGAYDMAGNVWEWTSSWYAANYYQQRIKNDPVGAERGELRVARGSSWYLDPSNARSVNRRDRPFVLETVSGIRVVSPIQ